MQPMAVATKELLLLTVSIAAAAATADVADHVRGLGM